MPAVTIVDAGTAPARHDAGAHVTVRPTVGPDTGFDVLHQAVLEVAPGAASPVLAVGEVEETLFVLGGEGALHVRGADHRLEPEAGVYLPPGSEFVLRSDGAEPLRVLAVRVPDPSPGPPTPPNVRRLSDQLTEAATAERVFQIVADPATGLRSATHFVGVIPTQRAPDHFHTYDEVIYVLQGEGVMHADGRAQAVAPGSCIQLPARTVHCLQNTGKETMRVVAVFRPPGSPAAAFYPDGTPAFPSPSTPEEQ